MELRDNDTLNMYNHHSNNHGSMLTEYAHWLLAVHSTKRQINSADTGVARYMQYVVYPFTRGMSSIAERHTHTQSASRSMQLTIQQFNVSTTVTECRLVLLLSADDMPLIHWCLAVRARQLEVFVSTVAASLFSQTRIISIKTHSC